MSFGLFYEATLSWATPIGATILFLYFYDTVRNFYAIWTVEIVIDVVVLCVFCDFLCHCCIGDLLENQMGGLVTPPGGAESPQFPTRPCMAR